MKGHSPQRFYTSDCEPPRSPTHTDPLYLPSATSTLSHTPYLLPRAMDYYGALDRHHFSAAPSPGGLPPDCLMPLNNQLSSGGTFPRIHYNSHYEQGDFSPPAGDSIGGIGTGTLGPSMSVAAGMNMGLGPGRTAMITSGSATISSAAKMNRLPTNLLDHFEKQLPATRDGFSTLQLHRGTGVASAKQQQHQRTDSPGKIRYLVHSVQKLFAKSHSLESSAIKAAANGRQGGAHDKQHRRSKSKDRVKSDAVAKRRPRSNMSGYWSSDDLDGDIAGYRNSAGMMTLGRPGGGGSHGLDGQAGSKYLMQGYNTISEHTLKVSKSSSDLKHQGLVTLSTPGGGGARMAMGEGTFGKGGPWTTLTLGASRQAGQKGSATLDRSMLKSKSCHQELACHYLQMPQAGDWSGALGVGEIPCRRMRSGSYVRAMGDLEDSDDSDSSPKPSPKTAARRQSYLRATQQSLSDQFPSRNCLPSLREFSINRSLDHLDCIGGSGSSFPRWDDDDFSQGCSTLGRNSCVSQVRDSEMSHRYGDESCSESMFGDAHPHTSLNSRGEEPPDMPTCFRSRSHSYLRAIQAGCSQDDDTASMDSDSPPPTVTTVRTYSTSTVSACITTCKKIGPPPVPPRCATKPFISVTVQSSTESAQDGYLDGHDRKSEANGQSGRSDSSDSLDSARAGGLVKGSRAAPPAPVLAPREPQIPAAVVVSAEPPRQALSEPPKGAPAVADEPIPEHAPRRKLSSIGIQVDSIQEVQTRVETPPLAKFQSIGVQVEDGWTLSRSSSMASKQETDSDTQDLSLSSDTAATPNAASKPAEKKVMVNSASQAVDFATQLSLDNGSHDDEVVTTSGPSRQLLTNRSTTRSSSSSFSESLDPALDPSSLPPPDPWLESGNGTGNGGPTQTSSGGMSACRRDGHWFLKLLQAETGRMEGWCKQMEEETKEHQLSEEVLGKVRSAVGSAQLLMSQKFQQFIGLCEQNLNVNANPRPTAQDLAGFWDLLQLSIEDISLKFDELYHLKASDWKLDRDSPDKQENQKQAPPVPKKPGKSKPALGRERSGDAADKQRQEARKRLMAAKRAQSVKQNSTTESTDSIEIYVPEAQTRL
ncbi:disks large-associated protein 4 isoform X2 [Brachyhypopomus gauderio]|uniref:disks large-associated protein 4 isoform X2 n=1 Tax=Brachyhypopomus gauderio TaxID=698409 RepID=UPI0040424E62